MTDISDKAKIRALGQLVDWMFMHLVNKGVIEREEAKRMLNRMIEQNIGGNDEHVQVAKIIEKLRSFVAPTSGPKHEEEVESKRSKTRKPKRGSSGK